jgi:uncharacterized protein
MISKFNPSGTAISDSGRPFNDLSGFLKGVFGTRIQKLSIDAGFTCPNRDGTRGTGGCTFCNNQSFNPGYCNPELTVTEQLNKGKAFFSTKYPDSRYLAYFQAFTNTYANLDQLVPLYEEALSVPGIAGIVIGTRPDCIDSTLLDFLEGLSTRTYLVVEYGIESTKESTLIRINRGHTFSEAAGAIKATAERRIQTGAHFILGLPGETNEDMMEHARIINQLPVTMLKFHQLQILKGTIIEQEYERFPKDFIRFTPESYIDLVIRILEILRPDIILERFVSVAPPNMISSERWGLKNHELVARLEQEMARRKTYQGRLFIP